MTDLSKLNSWQALLTHGAEARRFSLEHLFASHTRRFEDFSIALPGFLFDYSKHLINQQSRKLLLDLARERNIEQARNDLFSGAKVNTTEERAALHTALRLPPGAKRDVDGLDITPAIQETLLRMRDFSDAVRSGTWQGHSGQAITDIVNIGIGGSFLGPQMATEALGFYHHHRLTAHYVANVEASELAQTLQKLNPDTTLFIVASKTFTTAETMQNATLARDWLLSFYKGDQKAVARHFVAASTNVKAVTAFGIASENMFPFSDWVGGRYSLWSAIGLSTMLMIGADHFQALLAGAHEMDTHFQSAPLDQNMPVIMALIGLWYRNVLHIPAQAVIPYHAGLRRLPAYLQQLDMESNGKSVTRDGQPLFIPTGPIIFGEPGTDAQHSFFQWLHQGTNIDPGDFIGAITAQHRTEKQQHMLLANMLAQSEALMAGRRNEREPHRDFNGNRPSTTLLLEELTPRTLGLLLALYEHKVFVQGVLWGINSFDQWGVELGKIMAGALVSEIAERQPGEHDDSTLGLLAYIRAHQD